MQLKEDREIEAYFTTDRQKHGQTPARHPNARDRRVVQMRESSRQDGLENPDRMRRQTVELASGRI